MNATTYNRQGRAESESMRLRAFQRYLKTLPAPAAWESFDYRGFRIEGRQGGRWYVARDPRIFTSKAKARAAVDRCLAVREEVARG